MAKWRFRLALFFVKMCRRPGRVRFNLPVAVTLNRAFTALRVFILGIAFLLIRLFSRRGACLRLLAARRQNHRNRPPHHLGRSLYDRYFIQFIAKLPHDFLPQIDVEHFPSAEHDRNANLVPLQKKLACVLQLRLEIMRVDIRLKLDLLDFDLDLRLFAVFFFLLLMIPELSVVNDLRYRRFGRRGDLHEIQPCSLRHRKRFPQR